MQYSAHREGGKLLTTLVLSEEEIALAMASMNSAERAMLDRMNSSPLTSTKLCALVELVGAIERQQALKRDPAEFEDI